jgi:hypothetical protein
MPDGRSSNNSAKRRTLKRRAQQLEAQGCRGADPDDDTVRRKEQQLHFQPRGLPAKSFDRNSFVIYLLFLALFLWSVLGSRSSDAYFFAQTAKTIVNAEQFEHIDTSSDYYEWLGTHFLPGMAAHSVASGARALVLVGSPRIKQLRAANCTAPPYMAATAQHCYDYGEEDTTSFGASASSGPAAAGGQFHWQRSDELPHMSWQLGEIHSADGFVVPDSLLREMIRAGATVPSAGTEFLAFPHTSVDVERLRSAGWWHPRTKAIFHDFTLYHPHCAHHTPRKPWAVRPAGCRAAAWLRSMSCCQHNESASACPPALLITIVFVCAMAWLAWHAGTRLRWKHSSRAA